MDVVLQNRGISACYENCQTRHGGDHKRFRGSPAYVTFDLHYFLRSSLFSSFPFCQLEPEHLESNFLLVLPFANSIFFPLLYLSRGGRIPERHLLTARTFVRQNIRSTPTFAKMKQRFSSIDVKLICEELRPALTGLRISNIYDLSSVSASHFSME